MPIPTTLIVDQASFQFDLDALAPATKADLRRLAAGQQPLTRRRRQQAANRAKDPGWQLREWAASMGLTDPEEIKARALYQAPGTGAYASVGGRA
jgi:hypothetical protein